MTIFNKLHFSTTGGQQDEANRHFPFEITLHSDVNAGLTWVTVRPGTITGLLPDNILDLIYINDDPNTKWYIKLQCQTNGVLPTFIWLFADTAPIDTSAAVAENTAPPIFEIILGIVQNNRVYQIVYNNLHASADIAFVESIEPPGAGAEPFLRWWNWKIVPG